MPLSRILDLRKKSDKEYAQDKRNQMSDQEGKQLSMEEAVNDAEMKPDESDVRPHAEEGGNRKPQAVRKVRASDRGHGKQLALEESLEEAGTETTKKARKSTPKRQTRAKGRGRQTTLDEKLDD